MEEELDQVDANEVQAKEAALREVERLLGGDDGLGRLPSLRAEYLHKRSAVERQMRVLQSARLDQASVGYILGKNCSLWSKLCRRYEAVDGILSHSNAGLVLQNDTIRKTNTALQNVGATLSLVDIYEAVPLEIELLIDDVKDADVDMLHLHGRCIALERIRDLSLVDARDDEEYLPQFEAMFDSLPLIRDAIDRKILGLIRRALTLAQQDSRLVVNACRAAEREQAEDRWWEVRMRALAVEEELMCKLRPAKDYKSKVKSEVRQAVVDRFENVFRLANVDRVYSEQERDDAHIAGILRTATTLLEDHETIHKYVVPCFPPCYNIQNIYLTEYHSHLMDVLSRVVQATGQNNLSALSVAAIINWYAAYRNRMKEWIGVNDEFSINLDLKDSDREVLARYYQSHFKDVLNQLVLTVVATDTKRGPNGAYISIRTDSERGYKETSAPEDLFGLVRSQLSEASMVSSGPLLADLAVSSVDAFTLFQLEMQRVLRNPGTAYTRPTTVLERSNSEHSHQSVSRKTREPPIEYVCAVVNNSTRCIEYSQELKSALFDLLDETYHDKLDVFERVVDGFHELEKFAMRTTVAHVFEELGSLPDKVFSPSSGTDVILDVLDVLKGHFTKLRLLLIDYHYRELVVGVLRKLVEMYMWSFVSGRAYGMRGAVVIAHMDSDLAAMEEFFLEGHWTKERIFVRVAAPLFALKELFVCDKKAGDVLVKSFRRLVELWPRFTVECLEQLLSCRGDVGPGDLSQALSRCAEVEKDLREQKRELEVQRSVAVSSTPGSMNAVSLVVSSSEKDGRPQCKALKWQPRSVVTT